jgi:hypothetical protein
LDDRAHVILMTCVILLEAKRERAMASARLRTIQVAGIEHRRARLPPLDRQSSILTAAAVDTDI